MTEILSQYDPIYLEEMSGIKLMNRTDTKFVTNRRRLEQLLEMAQTNYRVQEIDGRRTATYYTVYFDTDARDMFLTHHNGILNRQKLRIRSYVDSGLSFLEVKTKNNHRRTRKRRISIDDFDPNRPRYDISFAPGSPDELLFGDFLGNNLLYNKATVSQQLENRFSRITLVNRKLTERLTIDCSLAFRNLRTGNTKTLDELVIIELKRDGLTESPVLEMLRQLRIHPLGFSKYCMGTAMTDLGIKQNRFKSRIRDIEKILR